MELVAGNRGQEDTWLSFSEPAHAWCLTPCHEFLYMCSHLFATALRGSYKGLHFEGVEVRIPREYVCQAVISTQVCLTGA